MKVEKIDHVHAYVKDVDKAVQFFEPLLGKNFYPIFDVIKFGARVGFHPLGLELIQPTRPAGLTASNLGSWKEGDLCISLKVTDLDEAIAEMESKGIEPLNVIEVGKVREAFFDTSKTFGVRIELCEYQGHDIISASMD